MSTVGFPRSEGHTFERHSVLQQPLFRWTLGAMILAIVMIMFSLYPVAWSNDLIVSLLFGALLLIYPLSSLLFTRRNRGI